MYKTVFVLTSNRVSGESVSSDEVKDVVQDSINSQQNTHKQSQRCNLQEAHNLHETVFQNNKKTSTYYKIHKCFPVCKVRNKSAIISLKSTNTLALWHHQNIAVSLRVLTNQHSSADSDNGMSYLFECLKSLYENITLAILFGAIRTTEMAHFTFNSIFNTQSDYQNIN